MVRYVELYRFLDFPHRRNIIKIVLYAWYIWVTMIVIKKALWAKRLLCWSNRHTLAEQYFSRKQIATGYEMYAQTNALVRNNKRTRSFSLAFFPFIVDSQRRSSYRVALTQCSEMPRSRRSHSGTANSFLILLFRFIGCSSPRPFLGKLFVFRRRYERRETSGQQSCYTCYTIIVDGQ